MAIETRGRGAREYFGRMALNACDSAMLPLQFEARGSMLELHRLRELLPRCRRVTVRTGDRQPAVGRLLCLGAGCKQQHRAHQHCYGLHVME